MRVIQQSKQIAPLDFQVVAARISWLKPWHAALCLVLLLTPLQLAPAQTTTPIRTLTSIRQIRRLSFADDRQTFAVHLRALVTYFDPVAPDFFVHDATGGIWVQWNPSLPQAKVGEVLDLEGGAKMEDFAPEIVNPGWKVVGTAKQFPRPLHPSYQEMISALYDSEWVEVEGIVRQATYMHRTEHERVFAMDIALPGGNVNVQIPWTNPSIPDGFVDAKIRVVGVCGADFNLHNQQVGVRIYVPSLREIAILDAPEQDPFSPRPYPIGRLQTYGSQARRGHRLKIAGTVTAVLPGDGFYLQDDSGATFVETRQEIGLKPGDQVETLGFIKLFGTHVLLDDALVRRTARHPAPEPVLITTQQELTGKYDSHLVALTGRIVGYSDASQGQTLILQQGKDIFSGVFARPGFTTLPPNGSLVRIRGISVDEVDIVGKVSTFKVLTRSAADISVLEAAPWWTVWRALAVLGVVGMVTLLVSAWVIILRLRVQRQTLLISQKLSQEESLREAAQLASRAKSDFLANMSHEIRTPMNAIVAFTDILLDSEGDAEKREYLETVQFASHSLTHILNEILDFSKIEAGEVTLEEIPFSLSECVNRAFQLFLSEATRKGLSTECEIAPGVCDELSGDPYRLNQVIFNLLSNALKFTKQGSIVLKVACVEEAATSVLLQISVIDSGIGIPPEVQQRIFDSFHQADTSTTRRYGGTGLGLAICARLVALFGGRIWVASEPGQGSTFHFTARFQRPPQLADVLARPATLELTAP